MRTSNYSDDFMRDAVQQIRVRLCLTFGVKPRKQKPNPCHYELPAKNGAIPIFECALLPENIKWPTRGRI